MVEAGAQQVSEDEVLGALEFGHECCKKIAAAVKQLVAAGGQDEEGLRAPELNEELYAAIEKKVRAELTDALNTKKYAKLESYARIDALHEVALSKKRRTSRKPKPASSSST